MGHTEGFWQQAPLGLIAAALATLTWHGWTRSRGGLRAFQVTMLLSAVSSAGGIILHYRGNVQFELEMSPGLGGFALFKEAMRGATPALAPGTMILLGCLGLVYVFLYSRSEESAASHRRPHDDSPITLGQ